MILDIFKKRNEHDKLIQKFKNEADKYVHAEVDWSNAYNTFYIRIYEGFRFVSKVVYDPMTSDNCKIEMDIFASLSENELKEYGRYLLKVYKDRYVERALKSFECEKIASSINKM